MNINREPDTYVIQRVSFGDKPSGAIATMAMRKTAEMSNKRYPQAARTIINNSYDLRTAPKRPHPLKKYSVSSGIRTKTNSDSKQT